MMGKKLSKSGISNPSCYARGLENCVSEISGEHFISKKFLERVEKSNKSGKLNIQGPAWLPNNVEKEISASSMKAKVLCRKHNSDLSGIDVAGVDFCNYLLDIKSNTNDITVDARVVERWFLKVLCGFVSSGFLRGFDDWLPREDWLETLFLEKDFPIGAGLYYLISDKRLEAGDTEFGLRPVANDDLTRIVGLHFLLSGYTFVFLMSEMTSSFLEKHIGNGFRPIYRPSAIQVEYSNYIRRLNLKDNTGEVVYLRVTDS